MTISPPIFEPPAETLRRRADGRYPRRRDPLVLYEIVRVVAAEAARRDADPFKDPRTVAQAAWNSARRSFVSRYGHIPQAHEVQRQLPERDGHPFPWKELLDLVFDHSRNIKKTHEDRLSEPQRALTNADIEYAMLFIANRCGQETLLKHEYSDTRHAAIAGATPDARQALETRLPTAHQIETAAGDWDRALEIAGLKPRPRDGPPAPQRGLSAADAIVRFYCAHGYLPTSTAVREFAAETGFALEAVHAEQWQESVRAAIGKITDRDLPTPPPYGHRPVRDWQPISLNGDEPPPPRRTHEYSRMRVIEHVQNFEQTLERGQSATQTPWRMYRRRNPDAPSHTVITNHGGLEALVPEAARPDWRERALVWEAERTERQRSSHKVTAHRRKRVTSHGVAKRIDIMRFLRQKPASRAREIATAVAVTPARISQVIQTLEAHGYVRRIEPNPRSSRQTYSLTSDGEAALRDIKALRRALQHQQNGAPSPDTRKSVLVTLPPSLRLALVAAVESRNDNLNDVLVAALAEYYCLPFVPSGRSASRPRLDAKKILIRMSAQLKEEIQIDALDNDSNMNDTIRRVLAAAFGVELALLPPTRTTPLGGGRQAEAVP